MRGLVPSLLAAACAAGFASCLIRSLDSIRRPSARGAVAAGMELALELLCLCQAFSFANLAGPEYVRAGLSFATLCLLASLVALVPLRVRSRGYGKPAVGWTRALPVALAAALLLLYVPAFLVYIRAPRPDLGAAPLLVITLAIYLAFVASMLHSMLLLLAGERPADLSPLEAAARTGFAAASLLALPALLLLFWLRGLLGGGRPEELLSPAYGFAALFLLFRALTELIASYAELRGREAPPRGSAAGDSEGKLIRIGDDQDRLGLSPRERDVALALAEGLTYAEAAERLFISLATVQTHVKSIYRKADCRNKTELSALLRAGRD